MSSDLPCTKCTRPGIGESFRCLQHLDPDDLDKFVAQFGTDGILDVPDQFLSASLVGRAIRARERVSTVNGQPTVKRLLATGAEIETGTSFAGVYFEGPVDLDEATLHAEISFKGCTFTDEFRARRISVGQGFNASESEFHKDLRCSESQFRERANFSFTLFRANATFADCTFADEARFVSVECQGRFSMGHSRVGSIARFARCRFGFTIFSETEFGDRVSFAYTEFNDCRFIGSVFGGKPIFNKTIFNGPATFRGARFGDSALFADATFLQSVNLTLTSFDEHAQFRRTQFKAQLRAHESTFGDDAIFSEASFGKDALFAQCLFEGRASFAGAVFGGRAVFAGTRFAGLVRFSASTFKDRIEFDGFTAESALFSRAVFEAARTFGPATIFGLTSFDDALFREPLEVQVSTERFLGRRARFQGGTTFRLRWAELVLEAATFGAPSLITTGDAPADVDDRRAATRFRGDDPRPRLLSLSGADLGEVVLSNLRLEACRFARAHNLERMRIEASCSFATTPTFAARRQAIAEEHEWRHANRLRLPGWYPSKCQFPRRWLAAPPHLEPHEIASAYRALRKSREDSGDAPGAADFYYGETEMRRRDRRRSPAGERVVLSLYWLLSGYGLRASRSLVFLAILLILAAGVDTRYGFTARHTPAFGSVLVYVAGAATRLVNGPPLRSPKRAGSFASCSA
jgi:uncharacterized protein YjbI with pentapeptide repeats